MAILKKLIAVVALGGVITATLASVESDSQKENLPVNQAQVFAENLEPVRAFDVKNQLVALKFEDKKQNIFVRNGLETLIKDLQAEQEKKQEKKEKPKTVKAAAPAPKPKPKPKVKKAVAKETKQAAKPVTVSKAVYKPAQSGSGDWMTFTATYYNAGVESTGKGPGHPQYGITFSGKRVQDGVTAAVDDALIPLGTWLEVKYPDGHIEKLQAQDTGSAIKGRRIDIYKNESTSKLYKRGKHQVQVRIIKS